MTDADRPLALGLLDVLVGEWTQQVTGHGDPTGTDHLRVGARRRLPPPAVDAPAALPGEPGASSSTTSRPATFRQHYFDSRGVTRLYRMTFSGSDWTLLRTEPDFSELSFAQRYIGTIADDGRSVDGRWEQSHDGGETWEPDFGLRFERRP